MASNAQDMTPGADRDESGQYSETYPGEWFIDAIRDLDGQAGTMDVCEHVVEHHDIDKTADEFYDTTYKKLEALADEDEIVSTKVANARLWQLPLE